ncbi:hypothetical protein EDB85DRAFT_1959806 [Lactarius pseudohatsudake]|nr:hypothetical protein EDB85DRAFT_1959806 [Lactarius pseudohatsudake]
MAPLVFLISPPFPGCHPAFVVTLAATRGPRASTPFAMVIPVPSDSPQSVFYTRNYFVKFTIRVGKVPQAHLYFTVPQPLPRSWYPRNQHPSAAPVNVLVFRRHRGSPTQLHLGKII